MWHLETKGGEHKKIYDKVSRLILVEMIEEQVGIADGDFVIVCVSIVNNDKIFIMETYDSECYIITVKDIISNRTILEGEIISAQGESDTTITFIPQDKFKLMLLELGGEKLRNDWKKFNLLVKGDKVVTN